MRRFWMGCTLAVTLLASTTSAQAGWNEFWARYRVDYRRNAAWPEPFNSTDWRVAREPFEIQKNNGWRLQNTIGSLLFNRDTNEVNSAGEQQIKWIVNQAPPNRRAVFVLRGDSDEQTAQRVDSVQRTVSKYVPQGELPPILLTNQDQIGGSGEYFQKIDDALKNSMPSPRLNTGGGGGASGSSKSGK